MQIGCFYLKTMHRAEVTCFQASVVSAEPVRLHTATTTHSNKMGLIVRSLWSETQCKKKKKSPELNGSSDVRRMTSTA